MAIVPTEVFKHDAVAEEIVNAELDLVLTKGKSVTDARCGRGTDGRASGPSMSSRRIGTGWAPYFFLGPF